VQFRPGAILQYSKTPSLRSPEIEDEGDDEDENEAPHEWRPRIVQGDGALIRPAALSGATCRARVFNGLTQG
jgi:hypothetical protein